MVASETRQDCNNEDRICWSPMLCKSIRRCQKKAQTMKIRTMQHHHYNGDTARHYAGTTWSAVDDDTYDGAEDTKFPFNAMGWGRTEAEAIADLTAMLTPSPKQVELTDV
jgi:hypothetical protein